MKNATRSRHPNLTRDYIESFLVAVAIALILRGFVLAAYRIPTASMVPTLLVGDCIFSWQLPYGIRIPFTDTLLVKPILPKRGDVIVFKYHDETTQSAVPFVKRVVGLPGDKIQLRQKRLYINDVMATYENADDPRIKSLSLGDVYIGQKETFFGHSHYVMFRTGEEDDSFGPEVVPEGRLFVLGDNRDSSDDSRMWGTVALNDVEGRVVFIWCSLDWEKRFRNSTMPSLRLDRLFSFVR